MSNQSTDWDKLREDIIKNGLSSKSMVAVMPRRDPPRIFSSVCEGIHPIRDLQQGSKNGYYRS